MPNRSGTTQASPRCKKEAAREGPQKSLDYFSPNGGAIPNGANPSDASPNAGRPTSTDRVATNIDKAHKPSGHLELRS
jgi:hypothetical protein